MSVENPTFQSSHADKCRAGQLKWRDALPGIPPELADEFISKLRAGSTIRKLTPGGEKLGPALATLDRFKKHCELNSEWGAEAWRISKANTRIGKIARFRAMTHCKYGHPLADASLYQKDGYVARHCRTCRTIRGRRPSIIKPESAEKVRALLKASAAISSFTKAGSSGYVMNHVTFTHFRRQDAEIDLLAARVIAGAQTRAQKRRWCRVRNQSTRDQNNDYYKIRDMIPASNPHRDDIVARIFEDLLGGSLERKDVPDRVKVYIAELNKMYPTQYRKFGDGLLVSLDEVMFEDGSTTRGDNVSRGLWD